MGGAIAKKGICKDRGGRKKADSQLLLYQDHIPVRLTAVSIVPGTQHAVLYFNRNNGPSGRRHRIERRLRLQPVALHDTRYKPQTCIIIVPGRRQPTLLDGVSYRSIPWYHIIEQRCNALVHWTMVLLLYLHCKVYWRDRRNATATPRTEHSIPGSQQCSAQAILM